VRHIVIIRDECESQRISRLKLEQHIARMRDAKSVLRRLHENPDEAEFRNRTSRQLRNSSQSQLANPTGDSSMEFVLREFS